MLGFKILVYKFSEEFFERSGLIWLSLKIFVLLCLCSKLVNEICFYLKNNNIMWNCEYKTVAINKIKSY